MSILSKTNSGNIISLGPLMQSVEIIGLPIESVSIKTFGNPSYKLVKQKQSDLLIYGKILAVLPTMKTLSSMPKIVQANKVFS